MKSFFVFLFITISAISHASDIKISPIESLSDEQRSAININAASANSWLWWQSNQNTPIGNVTARLKNSGQLIEAENRVVSDKVNCYVLMVDSSLSMKPFWPDVIAGMNTFQNMRALNAAVFKFAESPIEVVELNSQQNQETLEEQIQSLKPQGKDTQLFLAIKSVLEKVVSCNGARQQIIVFSDGDAEDKAITLQEVVDLANDKQVEIHTVGFGDLAKSKTALKLQVLQTLSNKTSATYQHFSDASLLDPFFRNILDNESIGILNIDPAKLPFGTKTILVSFSNVNEENAVATQIELTVQNTSEWENVLVSIQIYTGSENPKLVVILSVAFLIAILILMVVLKLRKKNKKMKLEQKVRTEKELEKQESLQRDEEMRNALSSMQKKMDEFNPDQAVNHQGEPYAWLQDSKGSYYELVNYSTTIGRDSENSIVIQDPTVSRSHAILDYKNGQLVWTDRAPSNPTSVNGSVIDGSYRLTPGDVIHCGNVQLELKLSKD